MHEYFLACPNGGFFDYRRNEICTRRALGAACLSTNCDSRRALHKAWRVARGVVARGPGALPRGLRDVICISDIQSRIMSPYLPDRCQVHCVSNPVAVHGPQVNALTQDHYLFVGRLSPEKGAVQFAQAARRLGLQAVFVGDGPERAAVQDANPDAVITGWLAPADVQVHLGRSRALVFPSLWYECQPLVPIEALLRGVPVVAGAWGAAAEVIEDGQNGIIYDAPTVDSLCTALDRVRQIGSFDATELVQMTAPQTHLTRLLEIYEGMLARSASPG